MKDDDKLNILDIDVNSGKLTSSESIKNSKTLPEIIPKIQIEEDDTPLTKEQEEMINGTYQENEAKREIERAKAKKESEVKVFKTVALVLLTVVLCFYSFGVYLKMEDTKKQIRIQERVTFLTDNAVFNNNIRAIFTNLRTNAVELQNGLRSKAIYESKAKEYKKEIESEISSLHDNKNIFSRYDADKLYANLDERLAQAQALADYQKNNSEVVDIIVKTNAYITSEESSKSSYLVILEDYLKNSSIPYSWQNGMLKYQVD